MLIFCHSLRLDNVFNLSCLCMKKLFWCSLEASHSDTSCEYSQHIFSNRNFKKNTQNNNGLPLS